MNIDLAGYKRFFNVPCALIDNYIKLADGPALKLLLYLLSSENPQTESDILAYTGLTSEQIKEAVMFWSDLGVISDGEIIPAPEPIAAPSPSEPSNKPEAAKVVHAMFQPKDVADRLENSPDLKELFHEAELTLGRLLKHADHETLLSLYDYYGFDEQSIVLILGYCYDLGKTSARYFETVAKNLFEKGITDFRDIENEFERLKELHSYEKSVQSALSLDVKLSPKQVDYALSWKEMDFGIDLIRLARDRCVDSTNKVSFPYIDKILRSWKEKGIDSVEAANAEKKPDKQDKSEKERSFDLEEFDSFTLK